MDKKQDRQELIEELTRLEEEYKQFATRVVYSVCSNNAVEALNALPYITEGSVFDFNWDSIKVKKGKISYICPYGTVTESIEDFLEKIQKAVSEYEYSELLLDFYESKNKNWEKLGSDCSFSCQHHTEWWRQISTEKYYRVSVSHWQGEHLTEDSFKEIDKEDLNKI